MNALALPLLLLAAPAPSAPAPQPVTRRHMLGPVELVGVKHPMLGPAGQKRIFFQEGWVTRLSARVVDAEGREADPSYLCHMTFHQPPIDVLEHDRINLDEGMPELSLPEGFGFRVRAGEAYRLEGMLQSDEAATDRRLGVAVDMDFVPASSGRALRELEHLVRSVKTAPDAEDVGIKGRPGVWWVPAGVERRYESRFRVPTSRAHFMMFHLHRYARAIAIERADTGETLFSAPVEWDRRRHLRATPVYRSAEGLALSADVPYRLAVTYENPSAEPVVAMASVHVYYRRDPAAP